MRPISLSHSGAAGPRPITQSELATALALASTPDSSAVTPTTSSQVRIVESDGLTDGGNIFPLPNLSVFAQRSHVVLLFLPLGPLIQGDSSNNAAAMPAGTPVSNDLFSQALQQALQASNMSALQVRPQIRS